MPPALRMELFRKPPTDLIEDQPDQRLGATDVGWRHDKVERRWPVLLDEIRDPPVATRRHLGDHRIAVEPEEAHRGREHAGALVFTLVEEFPRSGSDDGGRTVAKMRHR